MTSLSLPVRALRGDRLRWAGGVALRAVRRAPFTWSFVAVLLVTTVVLRHLVSAQAVTVMRWASTNIDNLSDAPLRSFVASAIFLPDQWWLPYAVALVVSLGVLERRLGTVRAVTVFLSGHVIATVLTEGFMWLGVDRGDFPSTVRSQLDVGVSYGLATCVVAAACFLPGRLRWLGVAAVAVFLGVSFAMDPGMTSSGHLLAATIGLLWWPSLARRRSTRSDVTAITTLTGS